MLYRRLIGLGAAAALVLSACGDGDGTAGGALRENVIEPGITAIDEAPTLACGSEASSFRTALETYDVLEGTPAPDEQALIDAGLLRAESELWNVVDGRLLPQDPACGEVPTSVPTAEIVTEAGTGAAATVDDIVSTFTAADVESLGGADCARQLAIVISGASRYEAREGVGPKTFADAEGDFEAPVTMWRLVDGTLRPTPGSDCIDFVTTADE